jgi:hypothetical protein
VSRRGSNTPSHSILHTNGNSAVTFSAHFGIGSPTCQSNQIYEIAEEVIDSNVYRMGNVAAEDNKRDRGAKPNIQKSIYPDNGICTPYVVFVRWNTP